MSDDRKRNGYGDGSQDSSKQSGENARSASGSKSGSGSKSKSSTSSPMADESTEQYRGKGSDDLEENSRNSSIEQVDDDSTGY